MKAPQFRELKVAQLKHTTYNPARRTAKDAIRSLVDSISRVGLLYPILVTEDNKVVDGNRRLAAIRELGWETIPAFVQTGDAEEMYATVNSTSRKMGGNEALTVWLKEPRAVTPWLKARFERMTEVLGIKRVDKLCREGYSLRLFNRTIQIATYCGREDDDDLMCKIVDWLMDHGTNTVVQQAMLMGEPPRTILAAIAKDRPLAFRAVVSEAD